MAHNEDTKIADLLALAAQIGLKGFTPTAEFAVQPTAAQPTAEFAVQPTAEFAAQPKLEELCALATKLGIKGFAAGDGSDA